jgi:sulfur-oxidizing protein SoxA
MKKITLFLSALLAVGIAPIAANATPDQDLKAFRAYYQERFPDTPFKEFANGNYALGLTTEDKRDQWLAQEDFPPYEGELEKGKKLFETPFANGKTYASCFKNGGKNIRQFYPYFDPASKQVKTLEQEINECRVQNGEKPLKWKKGAIAQISAYMAYTSRGEPVSVKIDDSAESLAAYERGKQHFYGKRGQLNMSCADCHMYNSGNNIRADLLSAALGQPTGFPVFRGKWGNLGTMHRRFGGCNKQVRAKPFKAQSDEYKALEYFLNYMSNGLAVNAPSYRQ